MEGRHMTDLSQWAQSGVRPGFRLRRPLSPLFPILLTRLRPLLGLILPLFLLLAWWGASAFRLVPEQILPAPATVTQAFCALIASGDLQSNLLISLGRVFYGFAAGLLAGFAFGAGMGFSDGFARAARPTFLIVSQIPILAWLPFLMLLLGIGEALKVVLVAKSVFTPVALSTSAGIRGVPLRWLELARVLRLGRWQTIRRVVLPSALPQLFNGFRYGLTHAWLALVVVELLASYEGIGYLMVYSRQLFQLDVMVAIMLVIGTIGLVFDRLLALAEFWLTRRYGGAS
jgi:sulfonate transport system permease protein